LAILPIILRVRVRVRIDPITYLASEPVRKASRSKFHLLYLQLLIIEAILEI
jgi:hypothetical protein